METESQFSKVKYSHSFLLNTKSSSSAEAIYYLPGGRASNQCMCRPQASSNRCPDHILLTPGCSLPSTMLLLGGEISNGDSVAEEETYSLLLARTEEPLTTQHHRQFSRSFISSEPLGVQRNLFFQTLICPLWSVMLVCIAWKSPYFTGEAPLCSAFHFMRLLSSTGGMRKRLVRDILGEAEESARKISMDQSVLVFQDPGSVIYYYRTDYSRTQWLKNNYFARTLFYGSGIWARAHWDGLFTFHVSVPWDCPPKTEGSR